MAASRSEEPLRSIATTWLLLGLSYIPWTLAIARMAYRRTEFTVGTWTLVTPFVIVGLAPLGALLVFWNKRLGGSALFAILAVNALLSQGITGIFLALKEGHPFSLMLVLLSVASLVIIVREVVSTRRHV